MFTGFAQFLGKTKNNSCISESNCSFVCEFSEGDVNMDRQGKRIQKGEDVLKEEACFLGYENQDKSPTPSPVVNQSPICI